MMGARYVARLIATTLFEAPFPHPRRAFMQMLGIAAQESKLRYLRQRGGGPARGLFQCEPKTERDLWKWIRQRPDVAAVIEQRCNLQDPDVVHLECNLSYQVLLCRVYLLRIPEALPAEQDVQGQARYWKKYYNTAQGKGTEAEYLQSDRTLIAPLFQEQTDATETDPILLAPGLAGAA
jgi:hypothetical protein